VLDIPTKSVEDSASAVSYPHPGNPKSTLRWLSGSTLVLLLGFSLLHVRWNLRFVPRTRRLSVITASVHGQFSNNLYYSTSHSFLIQGFSRRRSDENYRTVSHLLQPCGPHPLAWSWHS
jgi:hypothetical protein